VPLAPRARGFSLPSIRFRDDQATDFLRVVSLVEFSAWESPMSIDNPYAPPQADLTRDEDVVWGPPVLARRLTRLAASFVDSIIGIIVALAWMYPLGIWDAISRGQNPPLQLMVAATILGFAVFLVIHGYFLKTNGQTIGKKLLGIRISDLDGNVPGFATVILLRYLPMSLVTLIPVVGNFLPLADVLFIFRSDRRCIHDLIAGTKVVIA
jgi:uncharacterized RDD family membrane protein YckC